MLKDAVAVQALRDEWETVRATQKLISTNVVWAFAGGAHISREFANIAYSLCLLFGFSVLEHALSALEAGGLFSSKARGLEQLMKDSQSGLIWVDFTTVFQGKERRDRVAHQRAWLVKEEIDRYLDAIEAELTGWQIL